MAPDVAPLKLIESDLLEMASRTELMFGRAVEALIGLDTDLALRVLKSDDKIDLLDLKIERACLELLATPDDTHEDLRVIGAVLKIITDIERVADLAGEIADNALEIDGVMGEVDAIDFGRLAQMARQMFHQAIEAYVKQDAAMLESVEATERLVDALHLTIRDQIFAAMRQDTDHVVVLANLLMAAGHVERVADHALNIAQRVAYMVTGEVRTHDWLSA